MTMWNELYVLALFVPKICCSNLTSPRVGLGWSFAFQTYGPEWRDGRKMVHHEFSADAFKKYRPVLMKETQKVLRRLLRSPEHFMDHMQKYALDLAGGSTSLIVATGSLAEKF